ncbi:Eco47II family restriction endonuclease [Vibrio atlanticus]
MKAFDRSELKEAIRGSIKRIYQAQNTKLDLYRNTLDCFSASIDSVVQGISLDEWMKQEKERQIQKTKQNAIGSLHEEILGSIAWVSNLPVGQLIDIVSHEKKVVAERSGYIGYYVEILPKGQKAYNTPFSPSDNKTKQRRASREDIRQIDGRSFYELLTGRADAIDELYQELPKITAEIIKEEFGKGLDSNLVSSSPTFDFNFEKAYGN